MKQISRYVSKEKGHTFLILILIVFTTLIQVFISSLQVWSFNQLVALNFKRFIQFEIIALMMWFILLFINHTTTIHKEKLITKITIKMKEHFLQDATTGTYSDYWQKTPTDYASILSNDIELIENKGFASFFNLIETLCLMLFSLILLYTFHYSLVVVTLLLAIFVTFLPQVFTNKVQTITQSFLSSKRDYLSKNLDILEGANILFSSNRITLVQTMIAHNSDAFRKRQITYTNKSGLLNIFISLISLMSQVGLSMYSGFLATQSVISLGVIGSVGNVAANVFNALASFSSYIMAIKSVTTIFDTFDVDYNPTEVLSNNEFTKLTIDDLQVTFGNQSVINDFNATFLPHKKYAIIGESGSGKTTLFNTILGRIDDYNGTVCLNNEPIETMGHHKIANIIGYAQQDKHIFNDTLYNNITLWQSIDDSNLNNVLSLTNLQHIDLYRNAYEANLSEGEKQRMILARALLLDRDILFIDEGMANLDKQNAHDIEQKLLSLNKTIVSITHHLDPTMINRYDEIIDLNKEA